MSKHKHHTATMEQRTEELLERRAKVELGGGAARLQKQHDQGKLTARERIAALLDPGTFQELDALVVHRDVSRSDMCQDESATGTSPAFSSSG